MSRECLQTAKHLAGTGYWRGCVNRCYYAAYSAVTGELVARGLSFPHGWNNPAHEQLTEFIAGNLPLTPNRRRRLLKVTRFLRRARESADHRPGATVDRLLALDCLRYAIIVLQDLEMPI